ncbi:DNA glycosylase AlkZ-like family protein [Sphaerisporangium aureirubrum]|uniref:DNA glycosylase AlkZ-like family protein n=1 Tax=Sphaerisporangium aureirubrum TaxID=1544736 RepID=A0ABW1NJK8_9ACTN
MAGVIDVGRASWLGFRWQGHGLGGSCADDVLERLLLLGFQDSRQVGAAQSMIQRTRGVRSKRVGEAISPDGPLVSMWSWRVAPHAHPVERLDFVRDVLAPREPDQGGAARVEAVGEVAAALGAVVTGPMSKGEASGEVTERVRGELVEWCSRCEARHVPDTLFRVAGRQAQIVLGGGEQRAAMLYPRPEHRQEKAENPRLETLNTYLQVNGPTTRTLFRDWLDGGTTSTSGLWKELDDLVRVQIGPRRYDLPEAMLDAVRNAPEPAGVVLVPANDPYLRQVDRALLVPDAKRRGQVWRPLSGPGALLVDGEVAGTWRYRRSDRELTVSAFDRVPPARREEAEKSAALAAEAVGDDHPKVVWA